MKLDLHDHFKIHPVVHVIHTIPYVEHPEDISQPVLPRPEPIPTVQGEEQVVDKVLPHQKRGRGYQFLTLMKGDPDQDSIWQPTRDFVDSHGTVTDVWPKYIVHHSILPEYH